MGDVHYLRNAFTSRGIERWWMSAMALMVASCSVVTTLGTHLGIDYISKLFNFHYDFYKVTTGSFWIAREWPPEDGRRRWNALLGEILGCAQWMILEHAKIASEACHFAEIDDSVEIPVAPRKLQPPTHNRKWWNSPIFFSMYCQHIQGLVCYSHRNSLFDSVYVGVSTTNHQQLHLLER